ncbi:DciA family protein [Thioalkalivibrio paradoxus]|uniref:DUF721 domain-containing protein n=1 Tax=Thioalkalivibrio paradoxus ARh 1 TaxID=713585 RepID=W0DSM7_9GAMM|nr:DciA family protein [Thioalkalivibrio paradoxus]AHF00258.1 hypothetical protein THITH_14425 [Thioalkalivibrio paradoxus ARh 1]
MPGNLDEPRERRSAPQPLARYIDSAWRRRSQVDAGLERDLTGLLGAQLSSGLVRVSLHEGTLILACRDRGTATELRFLQRDIRKTLAAAGRPAIGAVRVVFSGAPFQAAAAPRESGTIDRAIPAAARQALQSAAAGIADGRLAEALRRLAQAGARTSPSASG